MFSKIMVLWYGYCGWYGHDFKVEDVTDDMEFVGRDWMDDCMRIVFRCSRCGSSDSRFLGWGTVAENKPDLEQLKKDYHNV